MVEWQSWQARVPWALAACFMGSIETLLPPAEVIPVWPWQARQLSSCFRGWGPFAWARAWTEMGKETEKEKVSMSKVMKKIEFRLLRFLISSAARWVCLGTVNSRCSFHP